MAHPALCATFRSARSFGRDGPATHKPKAGTPTMGGLLILAAMLVPTLLWANLANPYIWIVMLATLGFGAIGFADDYLKVTRHSTTACSRATSSRRKPSSRSRSASR